MIGSKVCKTQNGKKVKGERINLSQAQSKEIDIFTFTANIKKECLTLKIAKQAFFFKETIERIES